MNSPRISPVPILNDVSRIRTLVFVRPYFMSGGSATLALFGQSPLVRLFPIR